MGRLAFCRKLVCISRKPYASAMEKQAFPLLSVCGFLAEYLTEDIQKELDMAFVSVGQKYGFVSAGDVYRQRIADARAEERQKAEEKAEKARDEERADAISVLQDMGMTPEKIAEFKAKLEALKK